MSEAMTTESTTSATTHVVPGVRLMVLFVLYVPAARK
jgi:hypothetical protein